MSLVLSLTFAAGVLLVFLSLTSRGREANARRRPRTTGSVERFLAEAGADGVRARDFALASVVAAVASGTAVQLAIGWPVVTVAAALGGLVLPGWYLRRRRERRRAAVEEALAEAVEALRDAVRIGLGLEEGLRALGRTGPAALRPVFTELERDARLAGLEEALRRAQGRVADPVFDTFVMALLTGYRVGGRNLAAVLDGLGRSVRATVQLRGGLRAEQAKHALSARIVAFLPLVLIAVIRATSPDYLHVFSSPGGQLVLALCLVSVAVGYAGMLRATALPEDGRVAA
jgi:tight adherence protein B